MELTPLMEYVVGKLKDYPGLRILNVTASPTRKAFARFHFFGPEEKRPLGWAATIPIPTVRGLVNRGLLRQDYASPHSTFYKLKKYS